MPHKSRYGSYPIASMYGIFTYVCHKNQPFMKVNILGGGFNPIETYSSKRESSPNRGENKIFETTT